MKIEDIYSNFVLNDGEILNFKIDFEENSCVVKLLARKAIGNQKFQNCEIELLFNGVNRIEISEDFRTKGRFSDITFIKTTKGEFYLSLDPFGNSGQQHENDNFIIVASHLAFVHENRAKVEIF